LSTLGPVTPNPSHGTTTTMPFGLGTQSCYVPHSRAAGHHSAAPCGHAQSGATPLTLSEHCPAAPARSNSTQVYPWKLHEGARCLRDSLPARSRWHSAGDLSPWAALPQALRTHSASPSPVSPCSLRLAAPDTTRSLPPARLTQCTWVNQARSLNGVRLGTCLTCRSAPFSHTYQEVRCASKQPQALSQLHLAASSQPLRLMHDGEMLARPCTTEAGGAPYCTLPSKLNMG
jgi:hypothetical protein